MTDLPTSKNKATPESGTNDLAPVSSAATGDEVLLHIELDEPLDPDVKVTFKVQIFDPAEDEPTTVKETVELTETLTAKETTVRKGSTRKKAFHMKWIVKSRATGNSDPPPYEVEFRIAGTSKGSPVSAISTDKLFVPRLKVTKVASLQRIMQHEFAKKDGAGFVFDPKPLEDHLKTLTAQQKRLLLNYPIKPSKGDPDRKDRLVVFITLYSKDRGKDLFMCGDFCPKFLPNPGAKPNATFSVYHCRGPGKDVSLVCHTEHFLVNLRNPDTNSFINSGKFSGKPLTPQDWLDKKNPKPLVYKILARHPIFGDGHDGVVWCSILGADGKNIMKGNTLHGMINTVGCWWLFRNFNWPKKAVGPFSRTYCRARKFDQVRGAFRAKVAALEAKRPVSDEVLDKTFKKPPLRADDRKTLQTAPADKKKPHLPAAEIDKIADHLWSDLLYDDTDGLGAGGYKKPASGGDMSSFDKFWDGDRNFAFSRFYRHVVGIKYYGKAWKYGIDYEPANIDTKQASWWTKITSIKHNWTNDHDAGNPDRAPTMKFADVGKLTDMPDGDKLHHDPDLALRDDPGFKPDASLLVANDLGFKSATAFLQGQDADLVTLENASWADVYFYREDDVTKFPVFNFEDTD